MRCSRGHDVNPSHIRTFKGKLVCPRCRKLDASTRAIEEANRKKVQAIQHPSRDEERGRPADGPSKTESTRNWKAKRKTKESRSERDASDPTE